MVHSTEEMENNIIQAINQQIGSDVKHLFKVRSLRYQYQAQFEILEKKLNTVVDPETLDHFVVTGKSKLAEIENFLSNLNEKIAKNKDLIQSASSETESVFKLQQLISYFKLIRDIEDLSEDLKAAIRGTDESKMVELYLSLCGDSYSSDNVLGRSFETDAPNLKVFARRTALYWHELLTDKFSRDFEKLLKALRWPQIDMWNPSKDQFMRLQQLAQLLFMIKLPGDKGLLNLKLTPYVICPPFPSPVEVLLKAYKERFAYHFSGTKETNRLDKPEWYMTQILNWANEKQEFVLRNFQPAALKAGTDLNVRVEFIRGLVQLAVQKLVYDIDIISDDDALFSHLIDEVLSFEQELDRVLGFHKDQEFPSLITVITQPQYLSRWLAIEEIFASEKMDFILQSELAWDCLEPSSTEKLKIPRCADQFIRLLDSIQERYCNLPQPSHKILFFRLQTELIDNFQRRLVQLHNNPDNEVNTVHILNALNYVVSVLDEWGNNIHYLHMLMSIHGPNVEAEGTVFTPIIKELEHWELKLVNALAYRLVDDIKAKSMPYRHDNWIAMPEIDPKIPMSLSFTGGDMFQLLITILHELQAELSDKLFVQTVRIVARLLDEFFMDRMVMVSKFSPGGAHQFNFDMTRNLFALFGLYLKKPAVVFKHVNDACKLLTLPLGTVKLLHDTVKKWRARGEEALSALKEVGIVAMEPAMALEVIERRIDLVD